MTKSRFIFILFIIVTTLSILAIFFNSSYYTRIKLLKQMPAGSKLNNVIKYCKNNNYKCRFFDTTGYLNKDTNAVMGVQSIWTTLCEKSTFSL
jgi:hypothetical protein